MQALYFDMDGTIANLYNVEGWDGTPSPPTKSKSEGRKMRQVQEVTNARETQERPSIWAQVWTQAQYLNLALTIAGLIGFYLLGGF